MTSPEKRHSDNVFLFVCLLLVCSLLGTTSLRKAFMSDISCLTFGTGVLHLIQINHQPDATIFHFIIMTFVYSSTCFGQFPAHH
jgi:hypothetical protein